MDFSYTGVIQTCSIIQEGLYTIECWGASGGGPSRALCGLGAYSRSTYYLKVGDILKILAAGKGEWDGARGGGGGGSFVELNLTTLLCVAGGGGGSMFSRTPTIYSHGQAGKYAGNYAINGLLGGINTAGGSNLCSGTGGASYSNNSNSNGGTAPQYNDTIIIGATSFRNGGTGGHGTYGYNSGGYYISETDAQKGGFGGGGCGAVYKTIGYASAVGGLIYYFDGAGGGGGYSGGDSTRDGYGNTGGGGSSYYLGTTGVELSKSGYEEMPTPTDTISAMIGNYGNGFVKIVPLVKIILTDGIKYYIPKKDFFNIHTKSFNELTEKELENEIIKNTNMPYTISQINALITKNGETFKPSDIIDFTKLRLCIISNNDSNHIKIHYTPSLIAFSKSTIKVKDKYTLSAENILNPYLNIAAVNELGITYNLNYDLRNDVADRISSLIDTEVLKDNFYLSFKFKAPSALLSSVILYENKDVGYKKIRDDNLEISNNYENTFVIFKKAYSKVLVNKITKQYFKYYNNTLDKF